MKKILFFIFTSLLFLGSVHPALAARVTYETKLERDAERACLRETNEEKRLGLRALNEDYRYQKRNALAQRRYALAVAADIEDPHERQDERRSIRKAYMEELRNIREEYRERRRAILERFVFEKQVCRSNYRYYYLIE